MNHRFIFLGVGSAAAALIAFAGLMHRYDSHTEIPLSQPVAQRELRFRDLASGDVEVWDAKTGMLIERVTGQAGFLRATMRGLALTRLRTDDDRQTPFRLTAWADGRLTLDDPVTTRHLELEAFGGTNEAVFAEILMHKEQGS